MVLARIGLQCDAHPITTFRISCRRLGNISHLSEWVSGGFIGGSSDLNKFSAGLKCDLKRKLIGIRFWIHLQTVAQFLGCSLWSLKMSRYFIIDC